jgi:hypothetical protein
MRFFEREVEKNRNSFGKIAKLFMGGRWPSVKYIMPEALLKSEYNVITLNPIGPRISPSFNATKSCVRWKRAGSNCEIKHATSQFSFTNTFTN